MKLPSNDYYRSFSRARFFVQNKSLTGGGRRDWGRRPAHQPHDPKLSCRMHISVIERVRCPPDPLLRGKFGIPQCAAAAGGGGGGGRPPSPIPPSSARENFLSYEKTRARKGSVVVRRKFHRYCGNIIGNDTRGGYISR